MDYVGINYFILINLTPAKIATKNATAENERNTIGIPITSEK